MHADGTKFGHRNFRSAWRQLIVEPEVIEARSGGLFHYVRQIYLIQYTEWK